MKFKKLFWRASCICLGILAIVLVVTPVIFAFLSATQMSNWGE